MGTETNNERAAKLADILARAGLPAKSCSALGVFAHVTYRGESSARRAATMLAQGGWRVLSIRHSLDQTKESEGRKPEYVDVWRVSARPA